MPKDGSVDLWALSDLSTPWCVYVVVTLRVADHIAAGHTKIEDIAAAAGANADYLQRILRQLVGKGVFEEPVIGQFILNDGARGLLDSGFKLGLDLNGFGGRMANAWSSLLSAVKTGAPAYHEVFGKPFWEDLNEHPELAANFDAMMGPEGHGRPNPEVLVNEDWDSVHTVADVGGGTGALLAEILRARPALRGMLVDLPRTVARSAEVFQEAGVADRVTVYGQSFFDPLPRGADLYLLSRVLCDWPDPEAATILRRCAEAARPTGRVVILNGVSPDEDGPASPELLMLVLVGGKGRTLSEFRKLAKTAGLKVETAKRHSSGRFLVECRPEA